MHNYRKLYNVIRGYSIRLQDFQFHTKNFLIHELDIQFSKKTYSASSKTFFFIRTTDTRHHFTVNSDFLLIRFIEPYAVIAEPLSLVSTLNAREKSEVSLMNTKIENQPISSG
jgi:hypothetical protein